MGVGTNIVLTRSKNGLTSIWHKGNFVMTVTSEEELIEVIEILYTRRQDGI